MTTVLRLLGILGLLYLVAFTGPKLWKMAQIRGFVPGPTPRQKRITDKAILSGKYGPVYWVAWDAADIEVPGRNRLNLPSDVWTRYRTGDEIGILYFPGGHWPYSREDVYASNGNFAFDGVLLTIWLSGLAALARSQLRQIRRWRGQTPPPLPYGA